MDGSSWRPFYLVPFALWTREPTGGLRRVKDEKPRDRECSGRRVMVTANSDGQAYTLEEFIEHFGESVGLAEWQKASPVHAPSSTRWSDARLLVRTSRA